MLRGMTALALVIAASPAWAGDKPLYAPAPAWVTPAPPIDAAATGGNLLYDNQQRVDGAIVTSYLDIAQRAATTEALNGLGTLSFPWLPDKGDLIVHRVEILRGKEVIDVLKRGARFSVIQREQGLERHMMNGMLTATMPVEGLQVGDILRVSISITQSDAALKGKVQAYLPLLSEPFQSKFARARLAWSADAPIATRNLMEGVTAASPTAGADNLGQVAGMIAVMVTAPPGARRDRELIIPLPLAKPVDLPDDAPIRYRPLPLIEATSFTGWPDVSGTMAPLFATDGLIANGSAIAGETDAIAKAQADPLRRTQAALELVQSKVRYLLMGMNGGNYVPQTPARTWELRYGDCKAKTLLLLAMLRRMGIEAEAVLVNSQLGDMLPKRLPMPGAFDHVLVRATIDGKSYWLDGTGVGSRFADIADVPDFRHGLPLRVAGVGLIPIVTAAHGRDLIAVDAGIDDSAGLGLPSPYRATMTLRGALAETIATAATQASAKQKREMIGKLAADFVGSGELVEGDVVYDAAAGLATITAAGLLESGWSKDAKRFRYTLDRAVTKRAFAPDRARAAWRAIPVAIPAGGSMRFKLRVTLPDGGRGFALDGDQTLPATLGGVRATRSVTLANGVATMEDRLDETGGEIAPAELGAARTVYAAAKNRMLRIVAPADYASRAERITAARAAGRLKPIEAAYAKLISATPAETAPYRARAAFRTGVFDYPGAIADWTKVIALSPEADAYGSRSSLYEWTGQPAAAIADAEEAYKLDEDEGLARLARLRVVHGKRDEGLALIEPRIEAGGKERVDFMITKAELQGEAGDKDAALATMTEALAERPGQANLLNASCWLKGTRNVAIDTALKECTKAIELADDSTGPLDSRAVVYFRLGRLDEALVDLDAALDQDPDQSASLFMRGVIYTKLGRQPEAKRDLTLARLIWPQVDAIYKKYGVAP